MELNMTVHRRFPSYSDLPELEYCELFRRYKIRECYVLLYPLNDLKDNISIDRKKEIDQELISRFDVQQCSVLIKNPPFKFIDQVLLPKVLEELIESFNNTLVITYSSEFLQESAFNVFLKNKGKKFVNFTELYKKLYSQCWNLDYNQFIKLLYLFYQKFCHETKRAPENISIVIDAGNANISRLPETLKKATSPHAGMEMKGKRPGNLDYPEIEFPEKVAESPRKKVVKVFSQVGQTVKMLKKLPLPGRMEKEQHLLKRRFEEIALKIRSKTPPVSKLLDLKIKRKALALKVKKNALAKKTFLSLALKIKRKALDLKMKSKIPPETPKKSRSELCKKIIEGFPETEMKEKRPDNLDYQEIELPEKVAESPQKKVEVFSQFGQTVEMLKKQPLPGRMEKEQHLLKRGFEEIAVKIRSKTPPVSKLLDLKIKRKALALKVKKNALAKKTFLSLALKIKRKALAPKMKRKIPPETPKKSRSELCKKITEGFPETEMKEKRPDNLDYQEIELPEKVAESPQKKVEVFSQFGQTVEMLKKQPLPGRMEKEQHLLKRGFEEIAVKIRSKTPPVSKLLDLKIKRKALALKVKKNALAKKTFLSLALKIKRKALALKMKRKIPPETPKKSRSELCKKITEGFPETEMKEKRPGNLDYQEIELPEKVAESPQKKVEVFSQFGQTVEMLKKQPLPGRMEKEQHLLKRGFEEIAVKIRSKTPPVSKLLDLKIKRKALALKVKKNALAKKTFLSLALKIKRKALAPKMKRKIPPETPKKSRSELCKKITEGFPETEMKEKRPDNLDYQEIELPEKVAESPQKKEVEMFSQVGQPYQECITIELLPKVDELAQELLSNQLLQGNVGADFPLSEINIAESTIEILQKQHFQECITNELLPDVNEPAQEILSDELLQKDIEAFQSLFMIQDNKSALEILTDQPSHENVEADNSFSENNFIEPDLGTLQEQLPQKSVIAEPSLEKLVDQFLQQNMKTIDSLSKLNEEDSAPEISTDQPSHNNVEADNLSEPAKEIFGKQPSEENVITDQLLPDLEHEDPHLEIFQKQFLNVGIKANQTLLEIQKNYPALKLLQEQSVEESKKAVLSLPEIGEKKSGLEIPLLEKVNTDQNFSEITEDPPVLELMKQG
ncbi:hypothetical protein TNCT_371831 [Trichonephila clavata]|uniref:Uncharacterized protein n=1 Tax=Trichonephila clavata TaxID=2740835 RepID=A0A8X6IY83_TRICU|nr:hypothetical protein TNCT_371831 [Trichonephila clavata]